jgi:hypothetical protein
MVKSNANDLVVRFFSHDRELVSQSEIELIRRWAQANRC